MKLEIPKFKTAALQKEMMQRYYARGAECRQEGIPVAWVTAVFPVEILYAMDIFPYYPENYGAMVATRKIADKVSEAAEKEGYFHDLCGYARCGIGDSFSTEHPVGEIEKPDLIFCCNTQCGSLPKWFEAASRFYNAPYFLLDSPLIEHEPTELITRYYVEQLQEMIYFLEKNTGKKLDISRLKEVLELSGEACRLWNEVLDMAALKPAPFNYFDACFHMAPIVTWRGTTEAVEYYRALKEELKERVQNGVSVVPGERYKIYWDHIPVWPRLRYFAELFAEHGALVAASQYTHSWTYSYDISRPLESLAEQYTEEFVNRGFEHRIQLKMNLMKKYDMDGFVLFSNRSCKSNSFGLYDKKKIIAEGTGLPGIVFEADMSDLRFFSDEQIKNRLETFFEQLKEKG